jgi:maltokinase
MAERLQGITAEEIRRCVDEEDLREWVKEQRWYASKARSVAGIEIVESVTLREDPLLVLALVETRFGTGTHELYQLPLAIRAPSEVPRGDSIAHTDHWAVYDALAEPEHALELTRRIAAADEIETDDGRFSFHPFADAESLADANEVRLMGVEQSNSSVVFDDRIVLKVFRKLEPGVNPELEMLRFLTLRGFENIPALGGFYAYVGRPLNATLGIVQEFVPDADDGWALALDALGGDPESFPPRLRRLGEVTGAMHTCLAADASDPAFAPEEPSQEALPLLVATVDEEIEQLFLDLPDLPVLEPVRGRGEEIRERLRQISNVGPTGRMIRHHGDYHLGQVLWARDDWVVLDFEGEPARSLAERRRKRSPLRDVAGMLRSFAYAASAAELGGGNSAPEGWEARTREEFLTGYFETVDRTLIPSSQDAVDRLLSLFELEKAVYELRYELNHRPDWLGIPVAGILRLLEE